MKTSNELAMIADELRRALPGDISDEERVDHESIAAQVESGASLSEIREMDDGQWPDTYVWLKSRLSD